MLLDLKPEDLAEHERWGFTPFERRWDGEGEMPIRELFGRRRVPILAQIHPDRWEEVLLGLNEKDRFDAVFAQDLRAREISAADSLRVTLPPPPDRLAREALASDRAAVPTPEPDRRPGASQVNVRITLAEREELAAAAHIVGAKPTTLARILILNGVRKVIAEHAAVYGRSRG